MKKVFKYFALLKYDIRTITWPKKEELQKSFFVVLLLAALLGSFIFGLDYIFTGLYKTIIF
jgi:preprotein translocase SecE subunit